MLDMAGVDGRDPLEDYQHLREELENYSPELLKKPLMIAANKMDEPAAAENLKRFKKKFKKVPVLKISCLSGEGLDELRAELRTRVRAEAK